MDDLKIGKKLIVDGIEYIYIGNNTFKKIDEIEDMEISIVL